MISWSNMRDSFVNHFRCTLTSDTRCAKFLKTNVRCRFAGNPSRPFKSSSESDMMKFYLYYFSSAGSTNRLPLQFLGSWGSGAQTVPPSHAFVSDCFRIGGDDRESGSQYCVVSACTFHAQNLGCVHRVPMKGSLMR